MNARSTVTSIWARCRPVWIREGANVHAEPDGRASEPVTVSVVTVVRNGRRHIEEAIQSVLDQAYPNVEYVIIDGGSTDGTVDVIQSFESSLASWVSEPDDGI